MTGDIYTFFFFGNGLIDDVIVRFKNFQSPGPAVKIFFTLFLERCCAVRIYVTTSQEILAFFYGHYKKWQKPHLVHGTFNPRSWVEFFTRTSQSRGGRRGWRAVPRGAGWPTLPAPLVLGRFSCFFETPSHQSPGPARVGTVPRGSGSHYAHLGPRRLGLRKSQSAAACPRKSSQRIYRIANSLCTWERLDVHTELAIGCVRGSVSTYIQNWQLFVYMGASRRTYRIGNCLCTWEPFWGPI